jgi:hypothetical protein
VGQFPVLDFQYRIINKADTLVGRLTIQKSDFEAGRPRRSVVGCRQVRASGDETLADFFDSQLADEILHVRFAKNGASRHQGTIRASCSTWARPCGMAAMAFGQVMGSEGTEGVSYP